MNILYDTHKIVLQKLLHVLMLCNRGFEKGYEMQVRLAVTNDEKAKVSGRYFYHQNEISYNPEVDDVLLQNKFLTLCEEITGVVFPG